ncbi:hypothetical protein C8R47DRAFT_220145 [Mycena vitilis]|nr:hypothetical protein C8R47DRAFT_220145 [Mycena vitilis]
MQPRCRILWSYYTKYVEPMQTEPSSSLPTCIPDSLSHCPAPRRSLTQRHRPLFAVAQRPRFSRPYTGAFRAAMDVSTMVHGRWNIRSLNTVRHIGVISYSHFRSSRGAVFHLSLVSRIIARFLYAVSHISNISNHFSVLYALRQSFALSRSSRAPPTHAARCLRCGFRAPRRHITASSSRCIPVRHRLAAYPFNLYLSTLDVHSACCRSHRTVFSLCGEAAFPDDASSESYACSVSPPSLEGTHHPLTLPGKRHIAATARTFVGGVAFASATPFAPLVVLLPCVSHASPHPSRRTRPPFAQLLRPPLGAGRCFSEIAHPAPDAPILRISSSRPLTALLYLRGHRYLAYPHPHPL